jgi:biopolymer transport protein ExbD
MSKRSHKSASPPGVQLGLIITPMLDMAFQILAFFIMTYHPSALEAHIPGNLTPPEDFAKKNPKDTKPTDPLPDPLPSLEENELNPELDAAITIKIRAVVAGRESGKRHPLGGPSQIFLRSSLDTDYQLIADEIIVLDEKDHDPITPDVLVWDFIPRSQAGAVPPERQVQKVLERELKQMAGKAPKTNIKLAPDGDLKQEFVMKIYDTCKQAGFTNVHFVPPPVLNTKIK